MSSTPDHAPIHQPPTHETPQLENTPEIVYDGLTHLQRFVLKMQRTVGNQASQRILRQMQTPKKIQRDEVAPTAAAPTADHFDPGPGNIFNARVAINSDQKGKIIDKGLPNPVVIRQVQDFLKAGLVMPGVKEDIDPYKLEANDYKRDPKSGNSSAISSWLMVIEPLTLAVKEWQDKYNAEHTDKPLTADGRLTLETVAALQGAGLNPNAEEWHKRDKAEYQAVRDEESDYRKQSDDWEERQAKGLNFEEGRDDPFAGQRSAIVGLADSQVGKVFSSGRDDGNKYGWERLARYYQVATGSKAYAAWEAQLKEAQPEGNNGLAEIKKGSYFKGDTEANQKDHTGDWSWCAIFALWAVNGATGKGRWGDGGPEGLTRVPISLLRQYGRPGDIVAFTGPLNHHAILASPLTDSGYLEMVEGNLEAQEVRHTQRHQVSEAYAFYTAFPLPALLEDPTMKAQMEKDAKAKSKSAKK